MSGMQAEKRVKESRKKLFTDINFWRRSREQWEGEDSGKETLPKNTGACWERCGECELFCMELNVSCTIRSTEQLAFWNNRSVLVSCV